MSYIRKTYRIYPSESQLIHLNQEVGNQRFLWNYVLDINIKQYEKDKKFVFYERNSASLTALKTEFEFLAVGASQPLQQTLRDFDQALRQSFKSSVSGKRFPKFKKKSSGGSVRYPQGVFIKDKKLKLPKLHPIKVVGELPTKFNSVTIIKRPSGKWFASFVVPFELPEKVSPSSCVGVDLNSKRFVVTSEGEYVTNPKHLLEKEKKLKRYQRKFSRAKQASNNKEKLRKRLAKAHEKIANQRKDFVEKITTDLAKTYDVIAIEDLNVKAMQKWNGRMIQSAPFALFRSKLTWKANKYGKHLIVIGRYDPTSKMCSECGTLHEMPPNIRHMSCGCGLEMDRDLNAAKNILRFGLSTFEIGWEPAEFTLPETLRLQNRGSSIQWKSLKEETALEMAQ